MKQGVTAPSMKSDQDSSAYVSSTSLKPPSRAMLTLLNKSGSSWTVSKKCSPSKLKLLEAGESTCEEGGKKTPFLCSCCCFAGVGPPPRKKGSLAPMSNANLRSVWMAPSCGSVRIGPPKPSRCGAVSTSSTAIAPPPSAEAPGSSSCSSTGAIFCATAALWCFASRSATTARIAVQSRWPRKAAPDQRTINERQASCSSLGSRTKRTNRAPSTLFVLCTEAASSTACWKFTSSHESYATATFAPGNRAVPQSKFDRASQQPTPTAQKDTTLEGSPWRATGAAQKTWPSAMKPAVLKSSRKVSGANSKIVTS
mmetsp:Transcript_61322/g.200519  ORF Transcript_61322/g.200519 Transcript_61322/m.200519 type:complete len:312 (+) Transcript_61322:1140-2075(+)